MPEKLIADIDGQRLTILWDWHYASNFTIISARDKNGRPVPISHSDKQDIFQAVCDDID